MNKDFEKNKFKRRFEKLSNDFFSEKKDLHSLNLNPVLRALHSWRITSDQLRELIGNDVHRQWFSTIAPLTISDNVLILKSTSSNSSRWINFHYKELIDLLLSFQDKRLSCFFISDVDLKAR